MSDLRVREVPDNVEPAQVFDFDIYNDPRLKADLHAGFKSLHAEAPDIFWTPHHGGHWMVTRHELVSAVMRDSEHFTTRQMNIPKTDGPYISIPLNLDPPDHTPFRAVLNRYFSPAAIRRMEPGMCDWMHRRIDRVIGQGGCEFVEAVGASFPVSVFMELMGLPFERFDEFRAVVVEYFSLTTLERRVELETWIFREMGDVIRDRQENPGDDLVSRLVGEQIRGRSMTMEELQSICFLLFQAGLDTVANMLSLTFLHLAQRPDLQDQLANDSTRIPDFVEESLRRFAIVNGARMVKKDFTLNGAQLRVGDMIVGSLPLAGMDDRANADPMRFDIDRKGREHLTFSIGPHICVGHFLARTEMRIFTREWLKRIPRFRLRQGYTPPYRAGLVMALESLDLEWDVADTRGRD